MVQKEAPVNAQRLVRDFWATLGNSERPAFWSLIAANGASVLAHFSRPDIGLGMDPELGYP